MKKTTSPLNVLKMAAVGTLAAIGVSSTANSNYHGMQLSPTTECPDYVVLNYAYGSEKQNWTEDMVAQFNQRTDKKVGEKCVRINTQSHLKKGSEGKVYGAMGSGQVMNMAFSGRDDVKMHLVSPASSLFLRKSEDDQKANFTGKLFSIDESLVNSPIVIAMWEDQARALGWDPDTEVSELISWNQIISLASNPQGWASVEGADASWGKFKYGHTSPHKSNSGLMALVAEVMAAHGIVNQAFTEDLSLEDVSLDGDNADKNQQALNFVRELEKSAVRYGSSTGFYAKDMVRHGPDFIHAAVLYESSVAEINTIGVKDQSGQRKTALDKWGKRVVAIYPEEGTFESDHPFAVVNPFTNDEERAAAKMFYEFLVEPAQQRSAIQYGFRPSLKALATVEELEQAKAENGTAIFDPAFGIIQDLEAEEIPFFVSPRGEVINVLLTQYWQVVKKPGRTILLIDQSGSMSGSKIVEAKKAALQILDSFTDKDSVMVVPFNSSFDINAKYERVADADGKEYLRSVINNIYDGGGTAFLEATSAAYDYLCSGEKPEAVAAAQDDSQAGGLWNWMWGTGKYAEKEEGDAPPVVTEESEEDSATINSIIVLSDGADGNSDDGSSVLFRTMNRSEAKSALGDDAYMASRADDYRYPSQDLLNKLRVDASKECNAFVYSIYFEVDSPLARAALKAIAGETGLASEGTEKNIEALLKKLAAFGG